MRRRPWRAVAVEVACGVLVVGAVASLVRPALVASHRTRRVELCASNLKNIYYACMLYAYNNDEHYPVTYKPADGFCCWHKWYYVDALAPHLTDHAIAMWKAELGPNMRSLQALICPSDPWRGASIRPTSPEGTLRPVGDRLTSYELVRCLSIDDAAVSQGKSEPIRAHRLDDVQHPTRKILAYEKETFHMPPPILWSGIVHPNAEYNALFCDGHVKYVSYEEALPSAMQDMPGYEYHDPNYTVGGMSGYDIP